MTRAPSHLARALRSALLLAPLLAGSLGAGCASYPPGEPLPDVLPEINATLAPEIVILQPGDSISVEFKDQVEFNQQTQVRPDGFANFRLIGEVEVAGMTVAELQDELNRLYEREINFPRLLVRSGGLGNRNVFFMGSVGTVQVPLAPRARIDLIEALARIKAPQDTFTLLEHIVLIRWMADEKKRRYWIIDARPEYWTHPDLLFLQANDIVYIPRHPVRDLAEWIRELTKLIPLPYVYAAG